MVRQKNRKGSKKETEIVGRHRKTDKSNKTDRKRRAGGPRGIGIDRQTDRQTVRQSESQAAIQVNRQPRNLSEIIRKTLRM